VPAHDVILLDLDGTLADSSVSITRSLRYAFESEGFEVPDDTTLRSIIGPPFEVGMPRIGVHGDDVPRMIARYRERYEDVGIAETTLYPGVVTMLRALVEAGLTLALATAKPEPSAVRVIEHLELGEHLTVISGATWTPERRTKGDVITDALRRLGNPDPARVLMVGDREDDVVGAAANDIRCVGVLWGFGSAHELTSAGAWRLAASPDDVVAHA
jgi:phosphoglycolate phosphatase